MNKPELQRILYVEDEPDIQAVARLALEAVGGFTVQVCDSGVEAIHVAAEFAPDLILLDVMMPGMDGPQTLHRLGQSLSLADIPVVFMTARVQPNEIQSYRAMGAVDVISKPFDPMKLPGLIRRIWDEYHGESR